MLQFLQFILTSVLVCHQIFASPEPAIVPESNAASSTSEGCPDNFNTTCNLRCANGKYVLDLAGCPTCACAIDKAFKPLDSLPDACPRLKCRGGCGAAGYKMDQDGFRTCECASDATVKPRKQCPRAMCRMFCMHGFRRDEDGCEICSCNDSPQPCPKLSCDRTCPNGYRKDYSGCQTCDCQCTPAVCPSTCTTGLKIDANGCSVCSCPDRKPVPSTEPGCSPMKCDLDCKYGYERDVLGCELCSCLKCPLRTCRMFCMYGFKKNSDGCDVCECDWTPVSENMQCSERIPCTGNRVCNSALQLCELVSADKVNWFLYDFDVKSQYYNDPQFINTFKSGVINNIATKYDLEPTQITVSSIEEGGLTSFQIMPFYSENLDEFQKKMDRIDLDLNSHEFRSVLPTVARQTDQIPSKSDQSKWSRYARQHPRVILYISGVLIGLIALLLAGVLFLIARRRGFHPGRSESKSPIYDTSYHQAPTDEDLYHAVHAPDGTAYVVVESEDIQAPNDRRALV